MKRNIYLLIAFLFICLGNIITFSSADCGGALDNGAGNWTVAGNCTVSNGIYSAWGNTTIGTRTVTIASNAALITNLVSNTVTFTTGKIELTGNATIYGESSEFTWYNPDTPTGSSVNGGGITNCPAGTSAWNPITNSAATTVVHASRRGWVICK